MTRRRQRVAGRRRHSGRPRGEIGSRPIARTAGLAADAGRQLPVWLALLLLAWLLSMPLGAVDFTVNNTADAVDAAPGNGVCETAPGNGVCTLRAAVQEANALGGADTITLPAGSFVIAIAGADDTALAGDFDLTEEVTVTGAGVAATIVDGGGLDRVFDVHQTVTASFSNLTVQNGVVVGADGGGIRSNEGNVTLSGVRLTGNSARTGGALFSNKATLTLARVEATLNSAQDGGGIAVKDGSGSVVDSTMESNTASRRGGGFHNDAGVVTLTGVTLAGNTAGSEDGGGLLNRGGGATASLVNLTVSGNTSGRKGGGIHSEGVSLTLTNVTISGNGAPTGGGVHQQAGTVSLTNTLVANSTAGGNCSGTITDNGFNLADDASCGTVPATLTGLDPTLADNGGPTRTHALLAGSSALDTGTNSGCPATDQRGYARPGNAVCDVGAYEESSYDVVIDGDFSEWDNGVGNDFCVDDEGGADDWTNPEPLDITKFCIASDQSDDIFMLFAFDDATLSGATRATACILVDTSLSGNADHVVCITLVGPGVTTVESVELFTCDDSLSDGCGGATLAKTYGAGDYGFSNTVTGPFGGADSFLELRLPYADLRTNGGLLFSSLISYPGNSPQNLTAPKDSVFGAASQDYTKWVRYNLDTGFAATTPVTLAWFEASGGGGRVVFEWTTAAEASNVGFHLYGLVGDELRRLNNELIPSLEGDSIQPQHYRYEAAAAGATLFVLEDVDILGKARHHGPFRLGKAYGARQSSRRAIDWRRIGAARERARSAAAARLAGRSARPWRRPPRRPQALLKVDRTGIVRVTYEDLKAAGIDFAGVPLDSLAVVNRGRQVPIRVHGFGRFGPGAYVEFVGAGVDSLYSRDNVYLLRQVKRRGKRVAVDAGLARGAAAGSYLESRKVEVDRAYHFASPTEDPWYDHRLLAYAGAAEREVALELDGYLPGAGPVRLSVAVWGVTDFPQRPDHHLVVEVNGVELADEWFDGQVERLVEFEIPRSVLAAGGEDSLRLRLPGDVGVPFDLVNYDHYVVTYPRRLVARAGGLRFSGEAASYRVEGFDGSKVVVYRIAEGRTTYVANVGASAAPGGFAVTFAGAAGPADYLVADGRALIRPQIERPPPRVRLAPQKAEYLVIAHPDFRRAVRPLLQARRRQGLSVRVVDVRQIYQRYSHGIVDPAAIRSFIAWSRAESGTRYVLLVGGDTYDYHDYLGLGSISFIPSLYAQTDAIVRYAPADALLADVDRDGLPDLAIGRLPVRSVAELRVLIDKILDYERGGSAKRAVFAADALDLAAGYSFRAATENFSRSLPEGWSASRAYIDDLGLEGARDLLLGEMSAGVSLASYIGHSSSTVWSFSRLFGVADVAELDNWGRPMIVAQWGCWSTYYVAPGYDTLGHELLLARDRGAAAVLGAATLTEAESEHQLAQRFFAAISAPGATLGDALTAAKRSLAATAPDARDVILGVALLGDPAMVVDP